MKRNLIITGRWVLGHKDQWRLTIDPYIEVYSTVNNKLVPTSAFIITGHEKINGQRTFNANNVTLDDIEGSSQRLTLLNLGDLSNVVGHDYVLFLLLEPTDLSVTSNIIFEAYVDDIKLETDYEPLDLEIVNRLKALKSPTSITYTKRSYGGSYTPSAKSC